jgi:hypothetical protein
VTSQGLFRFFVISHCRLTFLPLKLSDGGRPTTAAFTTTTRGVEEGRLVFAKAWSFSWNTFVESHSFIESVTFVERLKRLSTKVTLSTKE